jgi:hypothetical protein
VDGAVVQEEVYQVFTMDADSDAERTVLITLDEKCARDKYASTAYGCLRIWKDNKCIESHIV